MFVSPKQASLYYGVTTESLRQRANKGQVKFIVTDGGHRRYQIIDKNNNRNEKQSYIYARVSSRKQEDDLKSQVSFLQKKYPKHKVITDIGSGINEKRKGYQALLDNVFNGDVKEIVVAHKDRLSRFSFDLIQQICKKFGTKLIIVNKHESNIGKENSSNELTEDLMSVITVFSARYYGRRKY